MFSLRKEKILVPSVLSANFFDLKKQLETIKKCGINLLHIDVMDGSFVPNITIGNVFLESLKKQTDFCFDVHLMIENPEKHLDSFINSGADILTVHQETTNHLDKIINHINKHIKSGVAINPATPISNIKHILDIVDLVLIMSVNPGFGGQKFIEYSYEKIIELDKIRKEKKLNFLIEVDGGVNKNNIKKLSNSGVDFFVAGSSVFYPLNNIKSNIEELKSKII